MNLQRSRLWFISAHDTRFREPNVCCTSVHIITEARPGKAKPSLLLGAPSWSVAMDRWMEDRKLGLAISGTKTSSRAGMCLDHCRVRVVGERPREADSGFSGGTRFCGTAGAPGLCRVEPEPRTTHRHQKNPADSGRSAIYRRRSRPHIVNPGGGGHRGVKIHAAPRAMSRRQGARNSPTERAKVGRKEADT